MECVTTLGNGTCMCVVIKDLCKVWQNEKLRAMWILESKSPVKIRGEMCHGSV